MIERELQQLVTDACAWHHVLSYHTFDSRRSTPGFPDLVLVGRRVLYRELKSTRGRLTSDQQKWLDRLTSAGADADVWRPADWPERILTEIGSIR